MSVKILLGVLFFLLIVLFVILFVPCGFADSPEFVFKSVSVMGTTATVQPVLPVQLKLTRIEGEDPATTIFQCTVLERKQPDATVKHLLKCGTAVYSLDGVLFSH